MAARKRVIPDQNTIERIRATVKTGLLVKALNEHVIDGTPMKNSQVRAAETLLRKTLPDLSTVTHSGDAENPIVTETIIRPQLTRAEWLKLHK